MPSAIPLPACDWCGTTRRTRFARTLTSTGYSVRCWCDACQRDAVRGRAWWSKSIFPTEQLEQMPELDPYAPDPAQLELLAREQTRCPVCYAPALLEVHHLAPRAQFGAECERWPTVRVCRPCHERWHARMSAANDNGDHP